MEDMEEQLKDDPFFSKIAKRSHKGKPMLDIKFYNYEPTDKSFAKYDPIYFKQVKQIEQHYEKKINRLLKEYLVFDKDTLNLVPKKENADLKDLFKDKMKQIDNKYERAVRELMGKHYHKSVVDILKKREENNGLQSEEDNGKVFYLVSDCRKME